MEENIQRMEEGEGEKSFAELLDESGMDQGWLKPGGVVVVETDTSCAKEAARILSRWYEGVEVRRDLTGRDRIAFGIRREA